jgi:hypothetical protein
MADMRPARLARTHASFPEGQINGQPGNRLARAIINGDCGQSDGFVTPILSPVEQWC